MTERRQEAERVVLGILESGRALRFSSIQMEFAPRMEQPGYREQACGWLRELDRTLQRLRKAGKIRCGQKMRWELTEPGRCRGVK